jgi:two-component system, OmpR family, manganese sensing response regulator
MAKVLLVEDNHETSAYIEKILSRESHMVEAVANGEEACFRLKHYEYDVIVLDWNLPGSTGPEICQTYRAGKGMAPILMLTGNCSDDEKAFGLDSGADDYLTKPFSLKELAARVRALLRRVGGQMNETLKVDGIELNIASRLALRHGVTVHLLPKEYSLLEFFMRHTNQVFSSQQLLERVWHTDSETGTDALRSTLSRLRQKLDAGNQQSVIETVHGFGFRMNRR